MLYLALATMFNVPISCALELTITECVRYMTFISALLFLQLQPVTASWLFVTNVRVCQKNLFFFVPPKIFVVFSAPFFCLQNGEGGSLRAA